MQYLELLAPARTLDIGIAAIDCGADAVYIAADAFGARKDAANTMDDVTELCKYAHRFGVRIYMTVNTIIYDDELEKAHSLCLEAQNAGVDALIVQDMAISRWDDITIPLHASTQCAIRTPETADFYSKSGCSRLVLERETSLEDIKSIRRNVDCELEYFVHGALCVCYSGQCYMSERISGRSANRGACIQACRSRYDLVDDGGRVLARDKALLSLKDYKLLGRLRDLAEAGICSFKIEGRLKNASYVKNVVREYSLALDALVRDNPGLYGRSSFGKVSGGFIPDSNRTFNRGYTELFLDGERGKWSSMETPKSVGEPIGVVVGIQRMDRQNVRLDIQLKNRSTSLKNGDGFSLVSGNGLIGLRGDVCSGNSIICKSVDGLRTGMKIFRNLSSEFERSLEKDMPQRHIAVKVDIAIGKKNIDIRAVTEDGRELSSNFKYDCDEAENKERQMAMIKEQFSKRSGHYSFVADISEAGSALPLLSASTLNMMRRLLAQDLDMIPCRSIPLMQRPASRGYDFQGRDLDYKFNVSNSPSRSFYLESGAGTVERAYELDHPCRAELMRTKYCIRYELGICPVHQGAKNVRQLYLVNNGQKFALRFDCRNCEMVVEG